MSKILGKDRDVNETIDLAKKILSENNLKLEESNIINPVEGIWSVHLKDRESQFYTNGKGGTREGALASAYCEFLERLGSGFFFDDYALDGAYKLDSWILSTDEIKVGKKEYKEKLLNKDLWDFYDPEASLVYDNLVDSGTCNSDFILAFPFNYKESKVYFPAEILKNIYASNGLSAGNTEKESLVQGISECIERGVKNYIIREGLSLPTISDDYLSSVGFLKIKEEIESHGFSVLVKDASLGGRFPVICVLLLNQLDGSVLSSFGSHPNPNVAIERTLTELLQGRKLDHLVGMSKLVYNIEEAADDSNIESHFINSSGVFHINIIKDSDENAVLWEFDGDRECELNYLKGILEKESYSYYYRSYDLGGIWVTQSIVPGLSEIYPVEDLEWDNRNRASVFREFFKTENCSVELVKKALDYLEMGTLSGSESIMKFMGISVEEDSPLEDITVDEVELLLISQLGKVDELKDFLNYRFNFESINEVRLGFWKCLQSLLNEGSEINLETLYGTQNVSYVKGFINGEIPRELYPILKSDFSYVEKHKEVLGIYNKFRKLRG